MTYPALLLHRRSNIKSLQAIARVEEAQNPTKAAESRGEVLAIQPRPSTRPSSLLLLRACRPRQWSKNVLVFAAPCAAGVIDRPQVALQAIGAFLVMCLVSSATYLVNDVHDREQDRQHPRKRSRPVASGALSPRTALWLASPLAVTGVGAAIVIAPGLGAVACVYLALTAGYSLWLRHVIVADIVVIAAGFVLRAVAGGVATDIYLSRWFVIVTACCAVFLVAAKRYAELREPTEADHIRATLRLYSLEGLRLTLLVAATLASFAYAGWAFTRPSHVLWYGLSIVPLLLWLGRYTRLIGAGAGQAPEELILRDRTLLALSVIWGLLFLGGVYVGH
ncbi:MAG TPA: decaprenyl-phosphate phosphoribosyltransferase [Solirubrobacteraceae bacterium]